MFWPKLVFLAGVGSFRRVSVRCFDEFGGVFGVRGGRVDCGDGRVSLQGRVGEVKFYCVCVDAGGRWRLIVSLGSQILVVDVFARAKN